MTLPDNWEQELMIHSWKMMRIDRCKYGPYYGRRNYIFPNGIRVEHFSKILVDLEFSGLVESLLEGWKYKKKVNEKKGEVVFHTRIEDIEGKPKRLGDYEDLWWELYSLDLK
ncbi:MAG: hypothetical protein ACW98Y_13205 [Candidatus Thorarchaeota archaeon]|jgi:hypothetical protein